MSVLEITRLDDPHVEVFRNVRDADLRGRDGLFMAESELVLRRLMRTPQRLHSILLSPEKFVRMRDAARRSRVPDMHNSVGGMLHSRESGCLGRGQGEALHRPSEFSSSAGDKKNLTIAYSSVGFPILFHV